MPMLLAVPITTRTACLRSDVFRSSILALATSSICARVSVASTSLPARPEAVASLAAFFKSAELGGVLIVKSKDLSL